MGAENIGLREGIMMKVIKPIDELMIEIKKMEFDAVLVPDTTLKNMINIRSGMSVGCLAYTPEDILKKDMLVKLDGRLFLSDYELCRKMVDECRTVGGFNTSFKFVAGEVSNFRRILKHTDDVLKYLSSETSKYLYRCFLKCDVPEKLVVADAETCRMILPGKYESSFLGKMNVGVVGRELFDNMQKKIIPKEDCSCKNEISLFRGEGFSINEIYALGNDRDIAEHAVSLINNENAARTAIVVNPSSVAYSSVLAALHRENIPYRMEIRAKDDPVLKVYFRLVCLKFEKKNIRVRDVRPLVSMFCKTGLPARKDDQILSAYAASLVQAYIDPQSEVTDGHAAKNTIVKAICDAILNIETYTFYEAAKIFFNDRVSRTSIKRVLDLLEFSDEKITQEKANLLREYLGTSNVLSEIAGFSNPDAILIASPSDIFIDRSNVIFLGMDASWNESVSEEPYIDKQNAEDLEVLRLSLLVQQGQRQTYIVNKIKGGMPSIPCQAFRSLMNEPTQELKKFESISKCINLGWINKSLEKFEKPLVDDGSDAPILKKFSKSSHSDYIRCPYKWILRSAGSRDNAYAYLGSLIHNFAEIYCYDRSAGDRLEEYCKLIYEKYRGYSYRNPDSDMKNIRNMVRFVKDFIDSKNIIVPSSDLVESSNELIPGGIFTRPNGPSEFKINDSKYCMEGNIDLLVGEKEIWDYKSGKIHSAESYLNKLIKIDECDQQALFYLALINERLTGGMDSIDEDISFNLLYIQPDKSVPLDMANLDKRHVKVRICGYDCLKKMDPLKIKGTSKEEVLNSITQWENIMEVCKNLSDYSVFELKFTGLEQSDKEIWKSGMIHYGLPKTAPLYNYVASIIMNGPWAYGNEIFVTPYYLSKFIQELSVNHQDLESRCGTNSFEDIKVVKDRCKYCDYIDLCFKNSEMME